MTTQALPLPRRRPWSLADVAIRRGVLHHMLNRVISQPMPHDGAVAPLLYLERSLKTIGERFWNGVPSLRISMSGRATKMRRYEMVLKCSKAGRYGHIAVDEGYTHGLIRVLFDEAARLSTRVLALDTLDDLVRALKWDYEQSTFCVRCEGFGYLWEEDLCEYERNNRRLCRCLRLVK